MPGPEMKTNISQKNFRIQLINLLLKKMLLFSSGDLPFVAIENNFSLIKTKRSIKYSCYILSMISEDQKDRS